MHHISVLHDIFLTLYTHLSGSTYSRLRLIFDKIIVADNLGTDKTLFKIRVDNSGRLGCLISFVNRPGTALVCSCSKESLKSEKMICALDKPDNSGLLKSHFLKEHLSVIIILYLSYFSFSAC